MSSEGPLVFGAAVAEAPLGSFTPFSTTSALEEEQQDNSVNRNFKMTETIDYYYFFYNTINVHVLVLVCTSVYCDMMLVQFNSQYISYHMFSVN